MIIEITLIFIAVAASAAALNRFDIPSLPLYILTGFLTGLLLRYTGQTAFVDMEVLQNMIYLGLAIVVFYATTRFNLDRTRSTSLDSFKSSIYISIISLIIFTGTALTLDFPIVDSIIIGMLAAFGSTLVNSKVVDNELKENHIHGWLTEDINLYQDIIAVTIVVSLFSYISTGLIFISLMASLLILAAMLMIRKPLSHRFLNITKDREIISLLALSSFIGLTLITENHGLTALTGIIAAGFLYTDTELGYIIRERTRPVKDFFAALSFFSIGILIQVPEGEYLLISGLLIAFITVIRPLLTALTLYVEGYDVRTSYLAGFEMNEASEISLLAALIVSPFISEGLLSAAVTVFAFTVFISHISEMHDRAFFDRFLSSYEFDPEKEELPRDPEGHTIIAGFDDKTQGLTDILDEEDTVVIDYDLDRIHEAEEKGLYHLLGDLYSGKTWEKAKYKDADMIVSAVSDQGVIDKIEGLETDAETIIISESDGEDVDAALKQMIREKIEEVKKSTQ